MSSSSLVSNCDLTGDVLFEFFCGDLRFWFKDDEGLRSLPESLVFDSDDSRVLDAGMTDENRL